MFKVKSNGVTNRLDNRKEANGIVPVPLLVLRCYRIDDGAFTEILNLTVCRNNGCPIRQCEVRSDGVQVSMTSYIENNGTIRVRNLEFAV